MNYQKTHHLFISHSWQYADHYNKLINLLKQSQSISFTNFSIPKNDPVHSGSDRELSAAIHNQMQSCGAILILAGVYASYSKWIDKEIKIAKSSFSKPKPIIAIKPYGSDNFSRVVMKEADCTVHWNTNAIVNAIKELTK